MKTPLSLLASLLGLAVALSGCQSEEIYPNEEFTVLVYNVENLFDVDGVALFSDYRFEETGNPNPYSPRKFLTKLENITRVVQAVNDGAGPEIILFNEFEYDRTPVQGGEFDYDGFLSRYAGRSVSELLTVDFDAEIADLPVEAFLLKFMQDEGLGPYFITIQRPRPIDDNVKAHTNAVFSKYPFSAVRNFPTEDARDILEVEIDINGEPLYLLCNHWKSGASSKDSEPTRYQNAEVLRNRIDMILSKNPRADIILGGDFNSNYNQNFVLPEVPTGVIDVLQSQGDELALQTEGGPDLYNLWFELPEEERFSEVYQSRLSTLMQILITPGLYDGIGVQYVDQSFGRLMLPGENVSAPHDAPIRWYFAGEAGGGYSDHLPVYARFRVTGGKEPGFKQLNNPSRTPEGQTELMRINYAHIDLEAASPASNLVGRSDGDRVPSYGSLFLIEGTLVSIDPLMVEVDGERFRIWSEEVGPFLNLKERPLGDPVRFYGEFGEHRGRQQFIIRTGDWYYPFIR